jgi:hypothetical protein
MFKLPANILVAGPTQSGKTYFISKLIEHRDWLLDKPPDKIYWFYAEPQPLYEKLKNDATFLRGLPDSFDTYTKQPGSKLLVIDDLMDQAARSDALSRLFTVGSHHTNTSVVVLVQNLFFDCNKYFRTISLNAHYLILFANKRDRSQALCLARQLYPGETKFFMSAYREATKKPRGYLVVDCRAETPEEMSLFTNIFIDGGYPLFYIKGTHT